MVNNITLSRFECDTPIIYMFMTANNPRNISLKFQEKSEAFASEFLENFKEMFLRAPCIVTYDTVFSYTYLCHPFRKWSRMPPTREEDEWKSQLSRDPLRPHVTSLFWTLLVLFINSCHSIWLHFVLKRTTLFIISLHGLNDFSLGERRLLDRDN